MSLQTRLSSLITAIGADIKALQTSQIKSFSETLTTSATSYVITHNLGTRDVQVQLYGAFTPFSQEWATIERTTINTITVLFATAPAVNSVRVVVQGRAD